MSDIANIKVGPLTLFQLIGIIGAVLGIVALFLTWMSFTVDVILVKKTFAFTGLDFIGNDFKDVDDIHKYMPLLATVFSVLALLMFIVEIVKPGIVKYGSILALVFGILVVVFAVVAGTWTASVGEYSTTLFDNAGAGIYVAIVGGILILLPALIEFITNIKE